MNWIDLHDDFHAPIPQRKLKPDPVIRNKYDWKIHKILDETKRVYIYPARGNNKPYTQLELYADLVTKKRDLRIIRATDIETAIKLLSKKPSWYDAFSVHLHERFNDYYFKGDDE